MGYETNLLFNDVHTPKDRLHALRMEASKILEDEDCPWSYMLIHMLICVPCSEEIELKNSVAPLDDDDDPWYTLDWRPEDGCYWGKWYHMDEFIAWISAYCACGQIYQYSDENGSELWGWEFDDGKFRPLVLKPVGRWRKSVPWGVAPREQA